MKISDSELEVMHLLWRESRPLSFTEIRTVLEGKNNWKKSTIQTLLTRLKDKGAIMTQENYVVLYVSNVNEEDYLQAEGSNFLNKLFDGSAKKLVASLCKGGKLDAAEVNELREFFKNLQDEEGK